MNHRWKLGSMFSVLHIITLSDQLDAMPALSESGLAGQILKCLTASLTAYQADVYHQHGIPDFLNLLFLELSKQCEVTYFNGF